MKLPCLQLHRRSSQVLIEKVISGIVDKSSLFNMEKYFPEEKERNTDDLTLLAQ